MKLDFIPLDRLSVSPVNMRAAQKRRGDIGDLVPLVRARGVLVPLIVRAGGAADHYEIVAGRRRFEAANAVAEEGGSAEPLPCAIIEAGDDAAALEASMMENSGRLDPDEVTRWESFTALVRQGRSIEQIADHFGLPDLMVRRALALGNLLPRIRDLYRAEKLRPETVRYLTLATKARQREWLALWDDPQADAPTGYHLKAWLFGGASIATGHALFDVATSGLATVADLFGEEGYFADSVAFWSAQHDAIEARRLAYVEAGWEAVVIVPPEAHFTPYEHEHCPKRKGGRVYIEIRSSGEVAFHEGYISTKEAQRRRKAESGETDAKVERPELTSTLQAYVHLHRHAVVRAELLGAPGVALRLMIATAIAQSGLWTVERAPRSSRNEAVTASAAEAAAEHVFAEKRRWALATLSLDADAPGLVRAYGLDSDPAAIFARLLALDDAAVLDILVVVMGESLEVGSVWVEATGAQLGIDMADWWEADSPLFDLLRDRALLVEMVAEVAGRTVAAANAKEKTKTLKAIICAHLDGDDGRPKVVGWVPRWMRFAPAAYTKRGGVETVEVHSRIGEVFPVAPAPDGPSDPDGPASAALVAAPPDEAGTDPLSAATAADPQAADTDPGASDPDPGAAENAPSLAA